MEQSLGRASVRLTMLIVLFGYTTTVFAQLPNKVGSLLTADRTLALTASERTPYDAWLQVTDENTVYFAPGPVNGLTHMKNRPNISDLMSWTPTFSGIAKSMELGFSTGPISFQRIGVPQRHGEYLTIWKRDRKGAWKAALHAVVEHYGNEENSKLLKNPPPTRNFIEPDSLGFLKHKSNVRLNQRKDVVASNDRLFASVLKTNTVFAFEEFLSDDVRFYFPWQNRIEGKSSVLTFLKEENLRIETEMEFIDRAYSGELAYTYGKAQIWANNQPAKPYNYIRIWQRQSDFQWRVILEFYSEL